MILSERVLHFNYKVLFIYLLIYTLTLVCTHTHRKSHIFLNRYLKLIYREIRVIQSYFIQLQMIQKLPEAITELHEIPVDWILKLETNRK